jgi:hypothetical protein
LPLMIHCQDRPALELALFGVLSGGRHQPWLPGTPLNGPARLLVIQPP